MPTETEQDSTLDFESFNVVVNKSGKVRHETMNGRDYYVADAVIMVEGVHTGSQGPYLYLANSLSKWAEGFDGKPVTIDHIKKDGEYVTHIDKSIIEAQSVGMMLNTSYDNTRGLATEAWIEKTRIHSLNPTIERKLINGEPIEVSIGIRAPKNTTSGVFRNSKGKDIKYNGVVKDFIPSHLALLTNEKGACSCDKGCGINNSEGKKMQPEQKKSLLSFFGNAAKDITLSFNEITKEIEDALRVRFGTPGVSWYGWVVSVYPDCVIYCNSPSYDTYMLKYTMSSNGEAVLDTADPSKVERVVTYVPEDDSGEYVANSDGTLSFTPTTLSEANNAMSKKTLIDTIIANGSYGEPARSQLEGLDETTLTTLSLIKPTSVIANCGGESNKQMTEEEWMKSAPPRVVSLLNQHQEDVATERNEISEFLLNAEGNVFTQEDIDAMPLPLLRKTATTLQSALEKQTIVSNAEKKEETEKKTEEKPAGVPIGRFSRQRFVPLANSSGNPVSSSRQDKLPPGKGLGIPVYDYSSAKK